MTSNKLKDFIESYYKIKVDSPLKYSNKKILVIGQCSNTKRKLKGPCYDVYNGMTSRCLNKLYKEYNNILDYYIISAGHGLINADTIIEPYDLALTDLNDKEIVEFGNIAKVRENLDALIEQNNYDLILVGVSAKYLKSLNVNKSFNYKNTKIAFLIDNTTFNSETKPIGDSVHLFPLKDPTQNAAKLFSFSVIGVKGKIIKDLFDYLSYNKLDYKLLYDNIDYISNFIETKKIPNVVNEFFV
jgi:hypothetical protein